MILLNVFYLILPAGFANMAPVLVKAIPFLRTPIDMGLKFRGKPLFGTHKTWRGLLFGVLFSVLIVLLQTMLFKHPFFHSMSIIDYSSHSAIMLGFLFGTGAILGDCAESFLKRQLNIKEGEPLLFFDQTDWVVGSMLFVSIVMRFHWLIFVWAIMLGFFLHIFIKYIGYLIGLGCKGW